MTHRFTQEEFDAIPVIHSLRNCPTGNYSAIANFGNSCAFGPISWFAPGSVFGDNCVFGPCTKFGANSTFGKMCSFGADCVFAEGCVVEKAHKIKDHHNAFLQVSCNMSSDHPIIAFNTEGGPLIRTGSFCGELPEFRAYIAQHRRVGDSVTLLAMFADMAELKFQRDTK